MKTHHTLGTLVAAGAVLALAPVGAANAATTGDTTATFTLVGGSLDITTADSAELDDAAAGAGSVSGSLGALEVEDTRGTSAGWVVTAASTTFVDGAGTISSDVSYNAGTAVSTGVVTATSTPGSITAAAPVAAGTAAVGNNTASYEPTLTVTLPSSSLAGDYSGTVTTSIS